MDGFPGSHIPGFGEPLLREVYAQGTAEAAALDEALRAIARSRAAWARCPSTTSPSP